MTRTDRSVRVNDCQVAIGALINQSAEGSIDLPASLEKFTANLKRTPP